MRKAWRLCALTRGRPCALCTSLREVPIMPTTSAKLPFGPLIIALNCALWHGRLAAPHDSDYAMYFPSSAPTGAPSVPTSNPTPNSTPNRTICARSSRARRNHRPNGDLQQKWRFVLIGKVGGYAWFPVGVCALTGRARLLPSLPSRLGRSLALPNSRIGGGEWWPHNENSGQGQAAAGPGAFALPPNELRLQLTFPNWRFQREYPRSWPSR